MKSTQTALGIMTIGLLCGSIYAHGEDADYGLAIIDGTVAVGIGDHAAQQVSGFGERVFAADMTHTGSSWFADEPGIFIEQASLADNTQVSFTLTDSLLYWNGIGPVSFSTATSPMHIGFGPASVSTSLDGSHVSGFSINYDADQAGGFDEHFEFSIDPAAAAGIYVLTNTFSLTGATDSSQIYTVFNAGLDEGLHDEAIEYVESVLVPTPGATGLLAMSSMGLVSRRRRVS